MQAPLGPNGFLWLVEREFSRQWLGAHPREELPDQEESSTRERPASMLSESALVRVSGLCFPPSNKSPRRLRLDSAVRGPTIITVEPERPLSTGAETPP